MNLFSNGLITNLLPYDGVVNYYGKVMKQKDAIRYFDLLLNTIEWKNDEAVIFGKHIITKRKAAWYGDSDYGLPDLDAETPALGKRLGLPVSNLAGTTWWPAIRTSSSRSVVC